MMSQTIGNRKYTGMIDCVVKTLKSEGPKAFYKGFLPQWMRFGPFNVIQFVVWEELRKFAGVKTL